MSIGSFHWDDCRDCVNMNQTEGGCNLNVPGDLNQMVIIYDSISCTKYKKVK